ncbi:DUF6193 family natural product biosynthesis protein [Streptomyces sp. NPDC057136]|uniref:DUF6193 family natural product biosynthesis protein n=1 Tax=Streptomyces sp. NPDC057136 TaxID=3346029 RepID=UPI00362ABD8A
MVTRPDPAVLYPDVAARGNLGAALRAVAEEEGFSLPLIASASDSLDHAVAESTLPHRLPLHVNARVFERVWSIRGTESFQDMALVEGTTDNLAQVARAVRAWHDGVALSDIPRAAPFVQLTGRFEVPDNDPVRLTASEWQHLRTEAGPLGQAGSAYRALVEAAHAEPALRGLYPFTSHWVLRFSATTRPHLSSVGPCVIGHDVDRYTVSADFMGEDVLARAATAQEAVAAAVRHLPPGLGPVTLGSVTLGS